MTEAETKEWHRLRMEYVVYYYDPLWKALWGRSGESESYLSVGSEPFPIKPRQRILVEGLIMPVKGMIVDEPKVTVLAENQPVEVLSTRGAIANTVRFNKRLVAVEGYVERQAARDANHHELDLIVEGRTMLVQFLVRSGEVVPQMKGLVVRVEGLYFARNEPTWPEPKLEIWVQGIQSITMLGQLDRMEPFSLPITPANQLANASPDRLVHVTGSVQSQQLGKSMTLRDETGPVQLLTAQTQKVEAGEPVEAVGLPLLKDGEWFLQQALFRPAQKVLTSFEDVTSVPAGERGKVHRLKFDYTVYYFDPFWKVSWGRCGGTDNYLSLGHLPFPLKPGQRVRIEGLVVPAKGLNVEDAKVTLLAESVPMEVLSTRGQIGNSEKFYAHLTTVEGYVDTQARSDAQHIYINLVTEGRAVAVQLLHDERLPAPKMEGSYVQAKGVYSATYDPTNTVSKIELWVHDLKDVVVTGTLDENKSFALPVTPIENLSAAAADKTVHVKGSVRVQQPGKSLTIRDETGQLTLLTAQTRAVQLGEQVEAIGVPVLEGTEWRLRDSLYRRVTLTLPTPSTEKSTLRLVEQLRELPPTEAARGFPVSISGIVTWFNPASDFFFVNDITGGVCVFQPATPNLGLGRGSKVVVTGVSASGKFSPVVLASSIQASARVDLPEAKQITLEQALTGIEDAQWVAMSGYVRNVVPDGPWARLEMTTSAGEFEAFLPWTEGLKKLRHFVVRLRGVCSTRTNAKRQLTGIQLWVGSDHFLEIEEPEPAEPFNVPAQTIGSLRQFSSLLAANRRVRVSGVVIYHAPGHQLLMQEGAEGLMVLSQDTAPLQPGDRIEAVGFPGRENNRLVLREAVYRKISSGAEPVPQAINSIRHVDVELDGQLIQTDAGLLELGAQGSGSRLVMQKNDEIFEAYLDVPKSTVPTEWEAGSRLALTGIYQVEFDEYKRPHDVHLLLRSVQDVRIVSRAPWLTLQRALLASGLLAVGILLGIGWVLALRRRVRQQIGQIHAQVESEKAARLDAALARASKLESLGVLAGGIAHDFNNLLTVVLGNLSLAKMDSRLDAETSECLQEGERAAQRARDLTQQLITFAKGGEPVRTVTHLPEVVRDATRFALHGSKVRCDYDIAPDLWPAEIDKGQIGQVVHNIIINATHAMPGGGVVTIVLRNDEIAPGARTAPAPGRYLRLSITDTGTGIEPEHLARIFDPYFTTKKKGSGLGLASAYSIIKKHHGHVEVKSKVGEGTTFHLWLPASTSSLPEIAPEKKLDSPTIRTARVLLMDDEPSIRQLGGAIFKRLGLDHTAVADGEAVLREYEAARAEGRPYDLVMLDLTVPGGMGGVEAMEKLRRLDPAVKAIVSSGYSNDPVMANYRAFGFLGVVPKPYVMSDFVKTIGPILPTDLLPGTWR